MLLEGSLTAPFSAEPQTVLYFPPLLPINSLKGQIMSRWMDTDAGDQQGSGSMLLIDGVGTEEAAGFDFVGIDDHGGVLLDPVLQQLLGHQEELVEGHLLLVLQVLLDCLLRGGLVCGLPQLLEIHIAVDGLVRIEGFLNLQYLILVESLVQIFLHLKVLQRNRVRLRFRISHSNNYYNPSQQNQSHSPPSILICLNSTIPDRPCCPQLYPQSPTVQVKF